MEKISVILNNFKNESSIKKCINSIQRQSYKNIEIIVLKNKDNNLNTKDLKNVIVEEISNEKEIYFKGIKKASGKYISFICGNDFISCDYYRKMIESIKINNSKIAIAEYALLEEKEYIKNQFLLSNKINETKNVLEEFIETKLSNDRWFINSLKLMQKELLDKTLKQISKYKYKSIINFEILLSLLLYCNTNKISFCDTTYFMTKKTYKEEELEIENIIEFIKKNKLKIDTTKIKEFNLDDTSYYVTKAKYNFEEEKIKETIIDKQTKIISFDMFDTLVVRPFYRPLDMFSLMNKKYIEITNSSPVVKFSKIRIEEEANLRIELNREITIDEIYEKISNKYNIKKNICEKMKELEKELEEKFCYKRKFVYELYELAKFLNKKVIVVSDIYLDIKTIENILNKNGYEFDEIYLSSAIGKTKDQGELYKYVLNHEKIDKKEMVHFGDNKKSDYEKAQENGIKAVYLPRTINKFMEDGFGKIYEDFDMFNINMNYYLKNFSIRCSLSIVANKYFDNPFRPVNLNTKFNADPELIGHYAFGMHLLSLSNWLLQDTKLKGIDSLSFISRDGFVPFYSTKIFKENTKINKNIVLNYIYASRKSLLPLVLKNKDSINAIETYVDYEKISPKNLYIIFRKCIKDDEKKYIELLKENNIKYNTVFKNKNEFYISLMLILDNMYQEEQYNKYYKLIKKYFNNNLLNNPGVFDIGYSGKTQSIISNVLNKKIHTYFYHTTSNEAIENSNISDYKLNTFYDFMPTLTGTIRELFYSDIAPTCIGYEEKNGETVPVFGKEEKYTYFNRKMIKIIQDSAIEFVDEFTTLFSDYIEFFDFNKFYMSSPYEYYMHYTDIEDKKIFNNLLFESNINDTNDFNYYIDLILNSYYFNNKKRYEEKSKEIETNITNEYKELISKQYVPLPKKRISRIIYYMLFNPKKLISKIKVKGNRNK